MSLFVAGRKAVCVVAQIIGGRLSAGEGKLRLTPGRSARHDASFLSALQLKLQTLYSSRSESSSLTGGFTEPLADLNTPPPTLYPPFPLIFYIQG